LKAKSAPHRIAYFITPHGFGHAARAASVMATLQEIQPSIHFDIFTLVPEWCFQDSLSGSFTYHALYTDIGLVQTTPLQEDLPKTLQALDAFLPFDQEQIIKIATLVKRLQCTMLICDIAPMGIVVAQEAGIPSVLIENFTWDWIYQGYISEDASIRRHVSYLQRVFAAADYHIQAEPVCCPCPADLTVRPISRHWRIAPQQIRGQLGIPNTAKAIVITMGGMQQQYPLPPHLTQFPEVYFIIPGASHSLAQRDNLILLPHHSSFFHPDLINACDGVIGKVGYSTMAEAYYAGIPFVYIPRPRFRESAVLATYIEQHMRGFAITEMELQQGHGFSRLLDLIAMPRIQRHEPNGAMQAGQALVHWLDTQ
jgi:uncharacterized protein (TIGR00661 family)